MDGHQPVTDAGSEVARLHEEIALLKAELHALRNDYEHALEMMALLARDAMTG